MHQCSGHCYSDAVLEFGAKCCLVRFHFFLEKKERKKKSNGGWSLSQWRQLSQVASSGSRSEGGGCHGSRGAWSLSGCDAAHTHTHTHLSSLSSTYCLLEVFLTAGLKIESSRRQHPSPHFQHLWDPIILIFLFTRFFPSLYLHMLSSVGLFIALSKPSPPFITFPFQPLKVSSSTFVCCLFIFIVMLIMCCTEAEDF